uniref:Uncharacterized protein n=1 Tax=Anguilla anguilla TaxID=7936 RepID=A0A0E9VDZ6_ANGAN
MDFLAGFYSSGVPLEIPMMQRTQLRYRSRFFVTLKVLEQSSKIGLASEKQYTIFDVCEFA